MSIPEVLATFFVAIWVLLSLFAFLALYLAARTATKILAVAPATGRPSIYIAATLSLAFLLGGILNHYLPSLEASALPLLIDILTIMQFKRRLGITYSLAVGAWLLTHIFFLLYMFPTMLVFAIVLVVLLLILGGLITS